MLLFSLELGGTAKAAGFSATIANRLIDLVAAPTVASWNAIYNKNKSNQKLNELFIGDEDLRLGLLFVIVATKCHCICVCACVKATIITTNALACKAEAGFRLAFSYAFPSA